jgi:DNA-binding NtrC family response regulator
MDNRGLPPQTSNFYCLPGRAGRTPVGIRGGKMPNRILVIEDDEATRYAYERALKAAGYQTAGFGTYFAAAGEIDNGAGALLLVDIQLPPGTPHGLSIARMARQHRPGLPIIFVTGYPEMAQLADAETGAIMLKPIDLGLLVNTVRDLLASSPIIPI